MFPNDAHMHLLLNHIPILGSMIATLLLAYGIVTRSRPVIRAALGLTVIVALTTIAVVETGHDGAGIVKNLPGVDKDLIHAHAERAEKAAIVMYVTGGLAFLGLALGGRERDAERLAQVTLVALILTSGLMIWTGKAGGEIHHAETRPGFVVPPSSPDGHNHDHDD